MVRPAKGKVLYMWRKELGISQSYFAKALGLSPGHLSRIERSDIYYFHDETYERIKKIIEKLEEIYNNNELDSDEKRKAARQHLSVCASQQQHTSQAEKKSFIEDVAGIDTVIDNFLNKDVSIEKDSEDINITKKLEINQLLRLLHCVLNTYYTIQQDKREDFIRYIQNYK